MELRQAIPKPVTVWKFIVQFVAVITFCSPFFWWGWYKIEAKAQEYVEDIIAPSIEELTNAIAEQTAIIEELQAGQGVEAEQSMGEAEALDSQAGDLSRLLCLMEAEARGEDPLAVCGQ